MTDFNKGTLTLCSLFVNIVRRSEYCALLNYVQSRFTYDVNDTSKYLKYLLKFRQIKRQGDRAQWDVWL